MAAGTRTVDPFPSFGNTSFLWLEGVKQRLPAVRKQACRMKLVFDTVAAYISFIGIADERWKISAARNRRHRFMLLTTDVLALVDKR